ncbi:MAG: hypothetical protein U1F43_15970 [Myxococcota bacterium]
MHRLTPPLAASLLTLTACLDANPGAVARPAPDAAAPDPFVEVRVGAVGVCVRTASGRASCSPGAEVLEGAPFTIVERGARELAASGTVIWHLELMACVTTDDGVTCGNGARRYTLAIPGAHALTVGDFTACALDADERIICWDPIGPAGAGDGEAPPDAAPATSPGPALPGVTALAASAYGACALDDRGAVTCWGEPRDEAPKAIALPAPALAISAGVGHTCARLADDTATCWGASPDDVPYPPAGPFDALDAGGWSTCILERGTGDVRCASAGTTRAWSLGALVQLDVGAGGVCGLTAWGEVVCAVTAP